MSATPLPARIRVIDSHTGGEPTRVALDLDLPLGDGDLSARRDSLRTNHDWLRRALCTEPRGSDTVVGALLCKPTAPTSAAGVIFFNNVGYLSMCGHGMIGLAATLAHLGRLSAGSHRIETPAGVVQVELLGDGSVSIENIRSYRARSGVEVSIPDFGIVRGDVAWGGNWFFLPERSPIPLEPANIPKLTDFCWQVRRALSAAGITGEHSAEIDHIELTGPPSSSNADAKNFVLCPGGAYDRSPCGTGTSAKLACLAADGRLTEGKLWRQESIIGSIFTASYRRAADGIIPTITGRAFVNAESTIIIDPRDPFATGIQ